MAQPNSNLPKKLETQAPVHSIDGYAVVEKIGAGSYSTVYKGFKTVCTNDTVRLVPFIFNINKLNNVSLRFLKHFSLDIHYFTSFIK